MPTHHTRHDHNDHHHPHARALDDNGILLPFKIGIAFNFTFFIAGLIAWALSDSISVFGSSLENFSHGFIAVISFVGLSLAKRPPDNTRTYGLKRFQVLTPTLNAVLLFLAGGLLIYWGGYRVFNPQKISSIAMLIVAPLDIVSNGIQFLFMRRYGKNLTVKSSMYHLLGDTFAACGVLIGGLIIFATGFHAADSIIAILIGLLSLYWAIKIFRTTVPMLLDEVPAHINPEEIRTFLKNSPHVNEVHDLHVWSVAPEFVLLTCHISVNNPDLRHTEKHIEDLRNTLSQKFGIPHSTIQVEYSMCTFVQEL